MVGDQIGKGSCSPFPVETCIFLSGFLTPSSLSHIFNRGEYPYVLLIFELISKGSS